MIIKKLDIVSFGKWNNKTIHFNDGFNYIYGPNEAGKSSVRMFITYILFGLNASEREQYLSKVDGQIGGRIHLEIAEEGWTIERFYHRQKGKPIVTRNGEHVSYHSLLKATNGLNRFLFESIFSFQDRDLQTIRDKSPEDIGKVLFNLGMTGSDQIVHLEKNLTKEMQQLYKKRGKVQPINQQLQQLNALSKQMEQAERKEREHQQLHREVKQLQGDLQTLLKKEQELKILIEQHKRLIQAKKPIVQYQLIQDQLKQLKTAEIFPKDGLNEYKQLKDNRQQLEEKLMIIESRVEQLKRDRDQYEQQIKSNSISDLKDLERKFVEAKTLMEQIHSIESDVQQKKFSFEKHVEELGIPFSFDELHDLNINLYTEENWKRLYIENKDILDGLEKLELKLNVKREEIEALKEKQRNITQTMIPNEQYEQLKSEIEEYERRQAIEKLVSTYENNWSKQKETLKSSLKTFTLFKFVVPTLLVIFFTFYLSTDFTFSSYDYLYLSLIVLFSVLSTIFFHNQEKRLKKEINTFEKGIHPPTTDPMQVQTIVLQIDEYEKKVNEIKDLQIKMDYIDSDLKEIEVEQERLMQLKRNNQKEILQVLKDFPFLNDFELFQWGNVHQSLIQLKALAKSVNQLKEKHRDLNEKLLSLEKYRDQYVKLYEAGEYKREALWDLFKNYLEKEKEATQQVLKHDEWIKQHYEEMNDLHASIRTNEKQLEKIYKKANTSNEDEFLMFKDRFEQYEKWLTKQHESFAFIYELFGDETEMVINQKYDWNERQHELEQEEEQLLLLSERLDEMRDELSHKRALIKQIEEDGTYSDLVHLHASKVDELKELAKKWAVIRTAIGYIEDTKSKYQHVYLPETVKFATRFFSNITDGNYVDIRFAERDETIYVKHKTDEWFNVKQISEGTADQLYVSLRLALNVTLNAYTSVPFVLDDAFVHFDSFRKSKMMDLLNELSQKQQVIYFTCSAHKDGIPLIHSEINEFVKHDI